MKEDEEESKEMMKRKWSLTKRVEKGAEKNGSLEGESE